MPNNDHDDAMRALLGDLLPPLEQATAGRNAFRQRRDENEIAPPVMQNRHKALCSALGLAAPLRLAKLSPDELAGLLAYLVNGSPRDLPPDLKKLIGAAIGRIRAQLAALTAAERAQRVADLRALCTPAHADTDDPLDYLVLFLLLAAWGQPRSDALRIALGAYLDTINVIRQTDAWGRDLGWTWPAPEAEADDWTPAP